MSLPQCGATPRGCFGGIFLGGEEGPAQPKPHGGGGGPKENPPLPKDPPAKGRGMKSGGVPTGSGGVSMPLPVYFGGLPAPPPAPPSGLTTTTVTRPIWRQRPAFVCGLGGAPAAPGGPRLGQRPPGWAENRGGAMQGGQVLAEPPPRLFILTERAPPASPFPVCFLFVHWGGSRFVPAVKGGGGLSSWPVWGRPGGSGCERRGDRTSRSPQLGEGRVSGRAGPCWRHRPCGVSPGVPRPGDCGGGPGWGRGPRIWGCDPPGFTPAFMRVELPVGGCGC